MNANSIVPYLWLIPAFPLLAAGLSALLPAGRKRTSAGLAIGSITAALMLSCAAFAGAVSSFRPGSSLHRVVFNFHWFELGDRWVSLGWLLDPITAAMLVMICFVGLLIFIFSIGYMADDANFTRFFCFLALFASAMLGLVISNSLLLLFICWELVGLTSYLLIGFWFHKPSAAAAAKKAFITTRIGDLALLLGMVWLYAQSGTLMFYDAGKGCLEQTALTAMLGQGTFVRMSVVTGISLLIFAGAAGKSGQVPLHVWLPDAMEGPTPVSALIHAATMVAAGVFLVARVFPLMAANTASGPSTALAVITWAGAITAFFAASVATAQYDIKRILAYSTVSQLGYMMMGLGSGGVAVGMFHLLTHAFFKALLFLGSGSVIYACHHEQDIRRMGGLRKHMPLTFATYAIGMLALAGFPLLFSGFWSKDEILHSAHRWPLSQGPFALGIAGAFLTAFYMTRQVWYVFFGKAESAASHAHESPRIMVLPLVLLAACAVLLGFIGTPAWPWFQSWVSGHPLTFHVARLFEGEVLFLMLFSSAVVLAGLAAGVFVYGWWQNRGEPDILRKWRPDIYTVLERKLYFDEIYEWSVVRFNAWWSAVWDGIDRWIFSGITELVSWGTTGLSWVSRATDEFLINKGFDTSCLRLSHAAGILSRLQNGQLQRYLRVIGIAVAVLVLVLLWGCGRS